LPPRISEDDIAAHAAMVSGLKDKAVWLKYAAD
jgi:DNA polymerase-3 subunit epsilon